MDAQPAGAGRTGAEALPPDRLGWGQDRSLVCRFVRGSAPTPATADHSRSRLYYTDLLKFLDASVSFYLGHGSIAGTSYGSDEAGAQATAQSERTKPVLVANRFHAISQASMMSAKLRNTELASQWLRR